MDNAKALRLIWKHTHRDYRGKVNGVKAVLVLRIGGTHLVPLTALTEAEVADKLKYAEWREARAQAGQKL